MDLTHQHYIQPTEPPQGLISSGFQVDKAKVQKTDEQVWVVPRQVLLSTLGVSSLVSLAPLTPALMQLVDDAGYFLDRARAERDPSHLQIIPYICLRRGAEIFTVTRLAAQGESRLHGRLSVGIGGHLNPDDGSPPFWPGLSRELHEEVGLAPESGRLKPAGIILDDSTEVGQVHCGIAYVLDLPADHPVFIAETDKMTGGWWTLSQLAAAEARLESWSAWLLSWLQQHAAQV